MAMATAQTFWHVYVLTTGIQKENKTINQRATVLNLAWSRYRGLTGVSQQRIILFVFCYKNKEAREILMAVFLQEKLGGPVLTS